MQHFQQLLVSASGGRARPRVFALPVSIGLHSFAAALAAFSLMTSDALPEPRAGVECCLVVAPLRPPVAVPGPQPRPSVGPPTTEAGPAGPTLPSEPTPEPEDLDLTTQGDVGVETGGGASPCEGCIPGGEPVGAPGPQTDVGVATSQRLPVRVGEGVAAPRKLRHVDPSYPELAKRARVEGTVILDCIIDPRGNVTGVQVVTGSPLLQGAALEAVRQWVYAPTLLNGVPVAVILEVTIRFELR